MGLYDSGKATALTTITAAVNARITTLADGSLSLDSASLAQWLADQGNLVVADVAGANTAAAKGVLAAINANPDANNLAAYISRNNWQTRPDWPNSTSVSNGSAFLSYITGIMQDMEQQGQAIEDLYAGYKAATEDIIGDVAYELALSAKYPPTEERIIDSRFYLYTYVNDWDEESAPSPVSDMVECYQNDEVNLTVTTPPTGRNVTGWRLYRTNVGNNSANYQLVDDATAANAVLDGTAFDYFNVTGLTYTDDIKGAELEEVLPSLTWLEPPVNLRGLVGLPNGVMAGFFDNTVAFCESYVPYAWPIEYQLTTHAPIVALGVFGQTLVVAHHAGVDYIGGADAASMSMQKDVSKQACVAPRSMVGVEGGVVYASPDGLCIATGSGVKLLTANHFTVEDWRLLKPDSIIGAYHELTYYFMWNNTVTSGCYALHLETGKLTTLEVTGSTFYTDTLTDRLYTAQGTSVVALFSGETYRTGKWRSKIAVLPSYASFAWLTVESDFNYPVTVKWYGDGVLRHTAVVTSRTPVRLPAGRYLEHEIEVTSQGRWNALTMASSTAEFQAS